jgi:hypothetical protein
VHALFPQRLPYIQPPPTPPTSSGPRPKKKGKEKKPCAAATATATALPLISLYLSDFLALPSHWPLTQAKQSSPLLATTLHLLSYCKAQKAPPAPDHDKSSFQFLLFSKPAITTKNTTFHLALHLYCTALHCIAYTVFRFEFIINNRVCDSGIILYRSNQFFLLIIIYIFLF